MPQNVHRCVEIMRLGRLANIRPSIVFQMIDSTPYYIEIGTGDREDATIDHTDG